jgi:type III pantothenate kinase
MTDPSELLIDAGNSRVKWAIYQSGTLDVGAPFAHTVGVLGDRLNEAWDNLPPPKQAWLSNVGGGLLAEQIAAWMTVRWPTCAFVQVKLQRQACGVTTRYESPERLGVDRWLALVGARASVDGAVCVVDCGTAITLDAMDASGVHWGGLIAPGLQWMQQGIAQRLPALTVAPSSYQGLLATNTAAGVLSGTLHAALGLIERSVSDVGALLGTLPELILTGGDAETLRPHLRIPCRYSPHLVLEGLRLFAESNR